MNDKESPLTLTWCDRSWLQFLNPSNVLEYFADRTNPFYDHTCNNEMLRMRGISYSLSALEKMQGIEYVLLHVQEPILYVIRKQRRLSPTATTTIANYYIIAGVVFQAPDLQSIIQSKMLTSIHYLQSAFDECFNYARFHPSTDYYWDFAKDGSSSSSSLSDTDRSNKDVKKEKDSNDGIKKKEISIAEANDAAQRMYRVDVLIRELVKKYPPKIVNQVPNGNSNGTTEGDPNVDGNNKNGTCENGTITTESSTTPNTTNTTNGNANTVNTKIEPEDDYGKFGSNSNANQLNGKQPNTSSLGPSITKKTKFN